MRLVMTSDGREQDMFVGISSDLSGGVKVFRNLTCSFAPRVSV